MRPRVLALAVLAALLAASAVAALSAPFAVAAGTLGLAEVRGPDGHLVAHDLGGPFSYPARGWAVRIGASQATRRRVVLRDVSLLGGEVTVSRIVVPAHGLHGASVVGLRVGGVPRSAGPNTVIGIGGGTYLVALQEAVSPGLGISRQGVVGLRVHVGSAMEGLRAGSELWVGLASATAGAVPSGSVDEVPSNLIPLYRRAGKQYGVPWSVLAAINKYETGFGHNLHVSSAGAEGWMQFLPSTWRRWGTDANGDGKPNPYSPADAITSAARYLAAAGAVSDLARAVFAYNHSESYVLGVLTRAAVYAGAVPIAGIAGALDPTGLGAR